MREGIVDFEKIRILRELAAKSTDSKIKKSMEAFESHLETFIGDEDLNKRDYDVPDMTEAVVTGKKMIDDLSVQLKGR
jgi:hypothetical protein